MPTACPALEGREPRPGRLAKGLTMSEPDEGASSSREMSSGDDRRLDFRPGMGMWWEITRSTGETSGDLFEATNWIEPRMPGPPVHVHPTAEESYEVIEGTLEVFMNGEWSPVNVGETATVAAGCRIRFGTRATSARES